MRAQCVARTVWLDKQTNAQMRLANGMDAPNWSLREGAICASIAHLPFRHGLHRHEGSGHQVALIPHRKRIDAALQ